MQAGNLQSLRHVPYPAFLWDVARQRVIWANAAAVAWFGAQGLADLVERPFDAREPGVRKLAEAASQPQVAASSSEPPCMALHFPSSGQEAPLRARVSPCALADGRKALLVVAEQTATAARPRVMSEILGEMPQPVLALTISGEPLFANAAALDLLGEQGLVGEDGVFASEAALGAFLLRAREAGTAVYTREAGAHARRRTLRLTARAAADDDLIIVMVDDITDRLRAERGELPEVAVSLPEQDMDALPRQEEPPRSTTTPVAKKASAALQPEELARLRQMMMALETPPPAAKTGEVAPEPMSETAQGETTTERDAGTPRKAVKDTPRAAPATAKAARQQEQAEAPAKRSRISIRVRKNVEPDKGEEKAEEASGPVAPPPEKAQGEEADEQPVGNAASSDSAAPELPDATAPTAKGGHGADETEAQPPRPRQAEQADATDSKPRQQQAAAPQHLEQRQERLSAEEPSAATTIPGSTATPSRAEQPSRPEPSRPEPPQLVRDVLDHRPEPIILHRSESFYFANRAARELFGYSAEDAAWDDIARTLASSHDGTEVRLPSANGEVLRFTLKRDVFPWRAGVVVQSTLQPLGKAREDDMPGAPAVPPSVPSQGGGESSGAGASISIPAAGAAKRATSHQATRRAPAPVIRIHTEPGGKTASGGASTGKAATDDAPRATRAPAVPAAATSAPAAPAATATSAADEARRAQPMDEELRAMLETAADGIITLNDRGEILSFSSGAERLFGHAAPRVLGRPLRDLLAEESRPALDVRLARLRQDPAAAGQRDEGREVLGLTADGGTIPLYLTIGVLQHAQPRDIEHRASFCAVVHDISAFKQRERELKQAKEQAEQRSARKSEFLARISHELRTPLNAILGFSDVLRQELFGQLGNEKYRDYARDIYDSGEHLLSLVNDLLDLARIEAGRYELDLKEVDLARIVEESVNILREQAAKAGITVRRVVPDDLPRVVADARSLKQILLNLLSNAVKYGREGDSITIALRQHADGGLELSVKDSGPGMSEEELRDALEPFRRVPRTGEDKPGTGLGLPLAKALAEANRARFEITSTPGKGTEARVIFPPHRVLA